MMLFLMNSPCSGSWMNVTARRMWIADLQREEWQDLPSGDLTIPATKMSCSVCCNQVAAGFSGCTANYVSTAKAW